MKNFVGIASLAPLALVAVACTQDVAADGASAPEIDDGVLSTTAAMPAPNGFTLTAQKPVVAGGGYSVWVSGSVVISGGTGTQNMGVCVLDRTTATWPPDSGIPCSDVSTCEAYRLADPTNGKHYCVAPNNSGQKYCFQIKGPRSAWCAGSPATGQPVGNGTFPTPYAESIFGTGANSFVSYGCYVGCTNTSYPGSVSPYYFQ